MAATQRDRIVDAFVQVVAERGYHGATVVAVCKQAGVSSKTFYVHFADKEQCFLAAYDRGVELLLDRLADARRGPGPWTGRLRRGIGGLLADLAAAPAFARMALVEVHAAGEGALERRTGLFVSCAGLFADAPWPAELAGARDEVVAGVVGAIFARMHATVLEGAAGRLPDLLPVLMYLSVAPFGGRQAATAELSAPA